MMSPEETIEEAHNADDLRHTGGLPRNAASAGFREAADQRTGDTDDLCVTGPVCGRPSQQHH